MELSLDDDARSSGDVTLDLLDGSSVTIPATAFADWTSFILAYQQGDYARDSVPNIPIAIKTLLDATPVPAFCAPQTVSARPAYLDHKYGRPETPLELLQFYAFHRHLTCPISPNEPSRAVMARRYGLEFGGERTNINAIAKVARAYFKETVLVTAVLDNKVMMLGQALVDDDMIDWTCAVEQMQPSFSLCRHSVLGGGDKVFVIHDPNLDWRLNGNQLFHSGEGYLGFYVNSPFSLPVFPSSSSSTATRLPIGGFCLMSPTVRDPGSFTKADQDLLANLGDLAGREIMRVFEEGERNRAEAQAAFLSEFIDITVGGKREDGPEIVSVESPSMLALRNTGDRAVRRAPLVKGFGALAKKLQGELLPSADVALVLDIRATILSGAAGQSAEWRGTLRPVHVMACAGMDEATAVQELKNQSLLVDLLKRVAQWKEGALDETAFREILPSTCQSSLAVPIFNSFGYPTLVVLLGSDFGTFIIEDADKTFIKNVGQLCLSALQSETASQSDKARLAFVSQLSHHLRTPLHGLAGQLDLIQQHGADPSLLPFLTDAGDCVEALRATIEEVLLLGTNRESNGDDAVGSPGEDVDLPATLLEVIKSAWGSYGKSDGLVDVILDVSMRSEGWLARANLWESKALSNVVKNACNFTKAGYVRVSLDLAPPSVTILGSDATAVKITVSDSGIGMEDEFLNEMFMPFTKADPFTDGAGLGLSVVQHLVDQMGGSILVRSTPGEGTLVEITLPLLLVPVAPYPHTITILSDELATPGGMGPLSPVTTELIKATSAPTPSIIISTESMSRPKTPPILRSLSSSTTDGSQTSSNSEDPYTEASSGSSQSSTGSFEEESEDDRSPRPLRIFAAEDNVISRNILTGLFKDKTKYEFLAVCDGQEAVDVFKKGEFRPDVTLMDLQMPRKDGISAAYEIREYEKKKSWSRHRIIALSALSNTEDRAVAMGKEGPIDAWLVKGGRSLQILREELDAMRNS